MDFASFYERHAPALMRDEVRHNLVLSILERGRSAPDAIAGFWSLGAPGACAIQQAGFGIALGDIQQQDAVALAETVREAEFSSVIGAGQTAQWFVNASAASGVEFPILMSETIHVLRTRPSKSVVPGELRLATQNDLTIAGQWISAFNREAHTQTAPAHQPDVSRTIEKKRLYLWCQAGRPVSLCGIGRVLSSGVGIAPVYTPPAERCRGFAGAATAALVNRILDRGYAFAYLYTDDHNPASNRCYEKVGFRPHCRSLHFYKSVPE